jgi:CRISPR-associated protein Cmr5
MKQIEKWIPEAIAVIQEIGIAEKDTFKVPGEFKGYFAAFAASIIQSGLLPAIIFYEMEESGAKESRDLVPKSILSLLRKQSNNQNNPELFEKEKLSGYVLASRQPRKEDMDRIIKAAVALKIALRTFNLTEQKSESNG